MSQSRPSRKKPSLSKLESKLARYALAGGAVLGAPLVSHAGTVYYSGVLDQTVSGSTGPGNSLSLNFPGTAVLSLMTGNNSYVNFASVSGTSMSFVSGNGGLPAALSFGSIIATANATTSSGKLLSFGFNGSSVGFKGGNWPTDSSNAYLGIIFTSNSQQYTGWAQINVTVNGAPGTQSATLVDYAYDTTPGESITAGQGEAPEPSTLAMFAMGGAAALALLRRRRAAARKSE